MTIRELYEQYRAEMEDDDEVSLIKDEMIEVKIPDARCTLTIDNMDTKWACMAFMPDGVLLDSFCTKTPPSLEDVKRILMSYEEDWRDEDDEDDD